MPEQQPEIAEGVASIDRIVHEPARLAILTVLASCERADFLYLERATGLTRGNLSVQMTRLEEAGLIDIEKTIEHKRTLTTASLRFSGRGALEAYWKQMDSLREMARPSLRQVKAVQGGRVSGRVAPACS
jgi:DNA-binding transcriptional ArsR family regulator